MLLKSKKLSLTAVLALLGATIVAPPAWAATVTVSCSVSGSITITDNVVTGGEMCTGSVEIPNTVTSIAGGTFMGANLVTITFEADSELTSIGDYAFDTSSLTAITIPNSVTSIGDEAFVRTALASIIIPKSVTSIGDGAFYKATALTSVTFEADSELTSIGNYAFRSATSLTAITIPNSVTSIGDSAFRHATSLTSVTFEADSLLASIGDYVFSNNTSLTSITIPNSVTSIENYAFENATALTSVTFEGNAPATVGTNHFFNVGTDAVANIGFAATGFGEESTWNGLILVRAAGAPAPTPYTGPLLQDFSSRTLDVCTPKSITITGIRLSGATASVQGKPVTVLENTDAKLVLAFPAGLTPGNNVDLVINSSSGTLTHQDAFDIPADTCAAEASKRRWTQLQPDGKTVKMYAKDPIGDGKIQFFVDGKEIAWVNAVAEADPKLSAAASGDPYLVRSVALKPGKNRFEIKLDGVRVWRATYVPKG